MVTGVVNMRKYRQLECQKERLNVQLVTSPANADRWRDARTIDAATVSSSSSSSGSRAVCFK